jgi:PAS domain S-box-containing protein
MVDSHSEDGLGTREKLSEQLRESEAMVSALLNAATEPMFVMDPEGSILACNQSFAQAFDSTPELMAGANAYGLVPPGLARVRRSYADRVVADGQPERFEDERGGRVFDHFFYPVRDAAGRTGRVVVFDRDITIQRRAERMLREREGRFRLLVENARDVVYRIKLGPPIEFEYISPAVAAVTGYAAEEFYADADFHHRLLHPEDRDQREALERAFLNGTEPLPVRLLSRGGEAVWVELSNVAIRDAEDKVVAVEGIARDVTARRRTEEALRTSEERFRRIFESSSVGIVLVDGSGRVQAVNPAITRTLGYSTAEFLSASPPRYTHPDDFIDYLKIIDEVDRAPDGVHETEKRFFKKNGDVVHARLRVSVLGKERGASRLYLATVDDITDRKRAEEERARAERLESLGRLSGGIAHDFNNLITAVRGYLSMARLALPRGHEAAEMIQEAESACVRAGGLTRQMLTFSRGGAPLKKAVAVERLLSEAADNALRDSAARSELAVPGGPGPDAAPGLWPVDADPDQMRQAFQTLILAAAQAMPRGSTVRAAAENFTVPGPGPAPASLGPGRYVKVSIADTGPGVPAEELPRLFDPYHESRTYGSGLALAAAYSIVKMHQGHLRAESDLGRGTVFEAYLPAAEAPAPEPEPAPEVEGHGRVLVMDDEAPIRRMLQIALAKAGYEPVITADGAEAVDRFLTAQTSSQPFDLVILDLTVPDGMGGLDALQQLKLLDPQVKAIVSSGYAEDPVLVSPREYGFVAALPKPYRLEELTGMVRRLLA